MSLAALAAALSIAPTALADGPDQPAPAPAQPGPPPAAAQPSLPPGTAAEPPPPLLGWYAPRKLPYVEGMPIPMGYHVGEQRRHTLVAVGASLFAASYLASVLTATTVMLGGDRHRSEVGPLYVPFAGPFVTLATSRSVDINDKHERTNGILLIADGVTQAAGALIFIIGMATHEQVLLRNATPTTTATPLLRPDVLVGPSGGAMTWRF